MPVRQLCQRFFSDILSPLHFYRRKALLDATSAVISGASLTLTSIGRHLPGMASVKHKIKRADRLLGNVHLHGECSTLFQRTTRYLTRNMPHVFILVDWSGYHSASLHLLRASLVCDGRSLPLMSRVVPISRLASTEVHDQFLSSLAACFTTDTRVTIITDGGFRGQWYRQVSERGWTYICRVVMGHQYYMLNGTWEKVSDVTKKASSTPVYLGKGVLGRDKKAQHEGYFYLYKGRIKGRKSAHPKARAHRANLERKAQAGGRFPWLILTNSQELTPRQVMKLYGRRMQIEQNFRDEKSGRYGFGLREGRNNSTERVEVLALIATLASIVMWLSGYSLENRGIHLQYQANTIKHRRVISLLTLAENVLRHSPLIFAMTSLKCALDTLRRRYIDMVLVY
ncbi:IS4 family transposase [Salmonella enterica]|nr:IS4 family transposase [Salmonella enterica subsp. enterica serovar Sandiego]EKK3319896.1 IS4 family transposase [Salmonella enterica]